VVGHDPPGHAVEPQPCLGVIRQVVEPAPGGQEGLGDDIGRVIGILGTAQHVPEDRAAVFCIHRLEAVLPFLMSG
jgi:hypothetical protein